MPSKIGPDGTVTLDGKVIGQVVKHEPDGLHIRGMSVSLSSKPLWIPTAADGTVLDEHGLDTRKAAVKLLEQYAQPLEVADLKVEDGLNLSGKQCVTATVTWQGIRASVSRYPHEKAWVIDCLFNRGSFFPAFSNGTGTRYTRPHFLRGEQERYLNNVAHEAGLLEDATCYAEQAYAQVEAAQAAATPSE